MKKLLIGIVFLFLPAQSVYSEEPIIIGGSEYPISTFTQGGEILGLDFDIVEAILKEAGITNTRRLIMPWKRIVYMLDNKKIAMVVPMVFTQKRKVKYNLAPSIRTRSNVLMVRKGFKRSINTMADLEGLLVGKCLGYAYQEEFMTAAEEGIFRTSSCNDNKMGLDKLIHKRSDALMIGKDAALFLVDKLKYKGLLSFTNYRAEKASHVGIHKSNVTLYRQFLKGYDRAKEKGVIKNIIEQWMKRYDIKDSVAKITN